MSKYQVGDDVLIRGKVERIDDETVRVRSENWAGCISYRDFDQQRLLPGNLMGIVKEIDDLRAKLAAAERERDEARKDAAEWELDCTTAEEGEKRMAAERDAARAEAATYRSLMPEVRKFLNGIATDYRHLYCQLSKDAIDLLAKLPPAETPKPSHCGAGAPSCPKCGKGYDEAVPCECRAATAEPKLVREWRFDNTAFWSEYRWDGKAMWRHHQNDPVWKIETDYNSVAKLEQLCSDDSSYRETTPQPAPAPVAGNVPLTLHGPAWLSGKKVNLCGEWVTVEVRA
jgi:hypothetical protein